MSSGEKRNLRRLDISGSFLYNGKQNMAKGNDHNDNKYHRYHIIFTVAGGLCDDNYLPVPQTDEYKIFRHCHDSDIAVVFFNLFYSLQHAAVYCTGADANLFFCAGRRNTDAGNHARGNTYADAHSNGATAANAAARH